MRGLLGEGGVETNIALKAGCCLVRLPFSLVACWLDMNKEQRDRKV